MSLASRFAPGSVIAPVLGLSACTASSPQPQGPSPSVAVSAEPTPAETSSAKTDAPAPTASAKPADAPPQSVITNEPPPGGTVTANASPAPAGSDRLQPMMDLIKANRDGFRKCFDLWGKKNPGHDGKIKFQFFLKVDGTLEKAQIKADESNVTAAEVETCMIAFAKTLAYPKSTIGKETIYTHPFDFKASSK